MAPVRDIRPGYAVILPNRDKASCQVTRLLVVGILLVTVTLMLIVTIGGWSELAGFKAINFLWCAVDLVIAVYILRWARGLLPIAVALAIILLIFAGVAGTGLAGTSWFDRNHRGYAAPQSLFGGNGFTPDLLAAVTVLMIPIEVLLIVVAMIAFAQRWNVELEVPEEEARRRGAKPAFRGPRPAAA